MLSLILTGRLWMLYEQWLFFLGYKLLETRGCVLGISVATVPGTHARGWEGCCVSWLRAMKKGVSEGGDQRLVYLKFLWEGHVCALYLPLAVYILIARGGPVGDSAGSGLWQPFISLLQFPYRLCTPPLLAPHSLPVSFFPLSPTCAFHLYSLQRTLLFSPTPSLVHFPSFLLGSLFLIFINPTRLLCCPNFISFCSSLILPVLLHT